MKALTEGMALASNIYDASIRTSATFPREFTLMLKSSIQKIALAAICSLGLLPTDAQAGPLIDWLFGRYRNVPAYPVGQPVPMGGYSNGYGNYSAGYAGSYGTYYGSQLPVIGPAGAGYSARYPTGIAATTMPQTLSYVPDFRTSAYRAPVTYYRPLLTTDPNTGAQVVAMAPCTSYEYQTQRVPAFGQSAYYGSNPVPSQQPMSQSLPTYTLPSGGIPLAYNGNGYSATSPYAAGYGGYSTLQPPVGLSAPAGAYPTAPLGAAQPYYGGANSGGSCGNYVAPGYQSVPGLVAPQAPTSSYPSNGYPSSGYPAPAAPGIYPPPPSNYPSADPDANVQPTLPQQFPTSANTPGNQRSQLRSVVRQPLEPSTPAPKFPEQREQPTMSPIPVPEGFSAEPRWNPGLLQEEDRTALRPIAPQAAPYVGQSKPIQWASFESPRAADEPAVEEPVGNRLRRVTPQPNVQLGPPEVQPSPVRQYNNTGWKSSR